MAKVSMRAEEFDNFAERQGKMTLQERGRRAGSAGGRGAQDGAAERHGFTQPRVLTAAHDVPRDRVRVEVWLPPELAQQVREMEMQAREQAKAEMGLR